MDKAAEGDLNVVWNYPSDPKTTKQRIGLLSVGMGVGIAVFVVVIVLITLPGSKNLQTDGTCAANREFFLELPEENDVVLIYYLPQRGSVKPPYLHSGLLPLAQGNNLLSPKCLQSKCQAKLTNCVLWHQRMQ